MLHEFIFLCENIGIIKQLEKKDKHNILKDDKNVELVFIFLLYTIRNNIVHGDFSETSFIAKINNLIKRSDNPQINFIRVWYGLIKLVFCPTYMFILSTLLVIKYESANKLVCKWLEFLKYSKI